MIPLTVNEEVKTATPCPPILSHSIWQAALEETPAPAPLGVPTTVGVIGASEGHHSGIPHSLMTQLLKSVEMPVFNGRADHFQQWKWEFEDKCRLFAQGHPLSEEMKTFLLEKALNEQAKELFHLLRRAEGMTYTPYMAKMEIEYGKLTPDAARARWERIELHNQGKVTSLHFREFETKFLTAMHEVKDTTPQEAYRLLFTKLPEFMRKRLTEHQAQLYERDPMVLLTAEPGLTPQDVQDLVEALIVDRPPLVEPRPAGAHLVHLTTKRKAKQLAGFHGRSVEGSSRPLYIQLYEQPMVVEDVFDFLMDWLKAKERGTDVGRARDPTPRNQGHNVREQQAKRKKKQETKNNGEIPQNHEPPRRNARIRQSRPAPPLSSHHNRIQPQRPSNLHNLRPIMVRPINNGRIGKVSCLTKGRVRVVIDRVNTGSKTKDTFPTTTITKVVRVTKEVKIGTTKVATKVGTNNGITKVVVREATKVITKVTISHITKVVTRVIIRVVTKGITRVGKVRTRITGPTKGKERVKGKVRARVVGREVREVSTKLVRVVPTKEGMGTYLNQGM